MGRSYIEAHRDLRDKLLREPYSSQVKILRETYDTTDTFILLVESPLIPENATWVQELVIDGDAVRFKRWADV